MDSQWFMEKVRTVSLRRHVVVDHPCFSGWADTWTYTESTIGVKVLQNKRKREVAKEKRCVDLGGVEINVINICCMKS